MTDFEEKKNLADRQHNNALNRQQNAWNERRRQDEKRIEAKIKSTELALTGNLDAMKLAHEQDVEVRQRDYEDTIRHNNLDIQKSLQQMLIDQKGNGKAVQAEVNAHGMKIVNEIIGDMLRQKLGLNKGDITMDDVQKAFEELQKEGKI